MGRSYAGSCIWPSENSPSRAHVIAVDPSRCSRSARRTLGHPSPTPHTAPGPSPRSATRGCAPRLAAGGLDRRHARVGGAVSLAREARNVAYPIPTIFAAKIGPTPKISVSMVLEASTSTAMRLSSCAMRRSRERARLALPLRLGVYGLVRLDAWAWHDATIWRRYW